MQSSNEKWVYYLFGGSLYLWQISKDLGKSKTSPSTSYSYCSASSLSQWPSFLSSSLALLPVLRIYIRISCKSGNHQAASQSCTRKFCVVSPEMLGSETRQEFHPSQWPCGEATRPTVPLFCHWKNRNIRDAKKNKWDNSCDVWCAERHYGLATLTKY